MQKMLPVEISVESGVYKSLCFVASIEPKTRSGTWKGYVTLALSKQTCTYTARPLFDNLWTNYLIMCVSFVSMLAHISCNCLAPYSHMAVSDNFLSDGKSSPRFYLSFVSNN
jgi:hypothetical protein